MRCLLLFVVCMVSSATMAAAAATRPADVSPLLKMSLDEVAAQVPAASGFYFIGCPSCHGGSQESRVLGWKPGMGDTLQCNFCGMKFPNEKFPNNKEIKITAPDGTVQIYRYYESPDGHQYMYEPHAWFERTMWLRGSALELATRFSETGDLASADRAATILARFAQVVPNYAVKFDFPFKKKIFWPADKLAPYEGVDSYRGSKFDWWGYHDIPSDLAKAFGMLDGKYDWKRLGGRFGDDPRALIENGLFRTLVKFTAANRETYHNMSPRMYREMIIVGRTIGEPKYVHDAVERFRGLVKNRFFADGWWMEGAPSYHSQTVNGLKQVADVVKGYTDPPEWTGEKFTDLDLIREVPLLARAQKALDEGVLPDGRMIPINDTWFHSRVAPTTASVSKLWPCMGQALLGAGTGETQTCLGVNWSGNYGHAHMDNGSIFLYALGHEMLPDIGYTHTKWSNWKNNSASHNMVVVDEKSMVPHGSGNDSTAGNLRWFDGSDPHVSMVDIDAQPGYPDVKTYRRRLALVHAAEGRDYVIDQFYVEGGKTHDLFLHGSADQKGELQVSAPTPNKVASLVPAWGKKGEYFGETDLDLVGTKFHAYGFLNEIESGPVSGLYTATWRYPNNALRAHMIPPAGSTLYRYISPQIRPAGTLDSELPKHMTPGIMQRHEGGESMFLAVYEPFSKEPWIESVKVGNGELLIGYKLGGKAVTDTFNYAANPDVMHIESSAGWSYRQGKPVSGMVAGMKGTEIDLGQPAPKTVAVRINFDSRSFVFPVESSDGNTLKLGMDPMIVMDSPLGARQESFPHDKLKGPIRWTVYQKQ